MRLPNMSNGAWIFASAVAVAIIAPGVYAATSSIVAIGNTSNDVTAYVVGGTHQLQTVTTSPRNMVHAVTNVISGCKTVYTPPAGKAIVVTQVTYSLGSGTPGTENFGGLFGPGCSIVLTRWIPSKHSKARRAHIRRACHWRACPRRLSAERSPFL
jgi:hypothetical protein